MINDHPEHGQYEIRDLRDDDEQWMWEAGCEVMRQYVEPVYGWVESNVRYFFDKNWRKRRVITVNGENAGWLELSLEGRWLYLAEIGLLPAFRNKGLGTQIIQDVLDYADASELDVELHVLVTNPAQRLYERMGFKPAAMKMSRQSKQACSKRKVRPHHD